MYILLHSRIEHSKKAASRRRQDRGRPPLMRPPKPPDNKEEGKNIRGNKSENVKRGIMETMKQCSARLNEPRRCAAPKVARRRDGQLRKTSLLVD